MKGLFHVNASSDVPAYRQLVDEIRSAVKLGQLAPGEQLPTVLSMAEELGLARGTIQRAYDELERLDLVEKIQGRGTFVRSRPPGTERLFQSTPDNFTKYNSILRLRRLTSSQREYTNFPSPLLL